MFRRIVRTHAILCPYRELARSRNLNENDGLIVVERAANSELRSGIESAGTLNEEKKKVRIGDKETRIPCSVARNGTVFISLYIYI